MFGGTDGGIENPARHQERRSVAHKQSLGVAKHRGFGPLCVPQVLRVVAHRARPGECDDALEGMVRQRRSVRGPHDRHDAVLGQQKRPDRAGSRSSSRAFHNFIELIQILMNFREIL